VTIETYRNPYFVAGDFNGDLSQDLAVVVKPAPGKIGEINDELANWMLGDPIRPALLDPKVSFHPKNHAEIARRRRVRADEGKPLLAVIHGFGSSGWRNPNATQTYVLKDAVGDGMRTERHTEIVRAYDKVKLPRIWGDVIAQNIEAQSGFLYYNGAKYAWYDPGSYKPPLPRKIVHGKAPEQDF